MCTNMTIAMDDIESLPPLPLPDLLRIQTDTMMGSLLTITIIACQLLWTHLIAVSMDSEPADVYYTLMCILALVALMCLLGLIFSDPGVVTRSQDTCFPMPEAVAACLAGHLSIDDLTNMQDDLTNMQDQAAETRSTYCIRCLVWRPTGAHHCSVCQRCVRDFDHHCCVFGRCIAGQGCSGNIKFFYGAIAAGVCGGLVCMGFTVYAMKPDWDG